MEMKFLSELAARRRFGMRPGLEAISALLKELGDPQRRLKAVHIAGTNGKGAVAAIISECLASAGYCVARYTSPHLMRLNERFFVNGAPVSDALLEDAAAKVERALASPALATLDITFFEALTAVAFFVFDAARVDYAVLEAGLGGRLDATNVCRPVLSVITRIGLDHCAILGHTEEAIAAEKAGIIKPGVGIVLGANSPSVREVVAAAAARRAAPFSYAPDIATEDEIPPGFSLDGAFNRENAVTAIAALRTLGVEYPASAFSRIVWPGRFQKTGGFLIDGAHNPPAARALVSALERTLPPGARLALIAGFCADKDVPETLKILSRVASRGFAVRTSNPRSLPPENLAALMTAAGIPSEPCATLEIALSAAIASSPGNTGARALNQSKNRKSKIENVPHTLIAGSLFLAGEALAALGAFPWSAARLDPSESLALSPH